MKRIKDKDLLQKRQLILRFGYEELLLTMEELAIICNTTKQNVSKILKDASNTNK